MDSYDKNIVREFPDYSHIFFEEYQEIDVITTAKTLSLPYESRIYNGGGKGYIIGTVDKRMIHRKLEKLPDTVYIDILDDITNWNLSILPIGFVDIEKLSKGYIPDNLYKLMACYYGEEWPKIIKFHIYLISDDGHRLDIPPVFMEKL